MLLIYLFYTLGTNSRSCVIQKATAIFHPEIKMLPSPSKFSHSFIFTGMWCADLRCFPNVCISK